MRTRGRPGTLSRLLGTDRRRRTGAAVALWAVTMAAAVVPAGAPEASAIEVRARGTVRQAPGHEELVAAARQAAGAGQWDRARGLLEQAVALRPSDSRLRFELGVARERDGDPVAAMEAYRRAWESDPDLTVAAENLAALLRGRGSADEAEHVIRQALDRRPDAASLHYHLALVLFERHQRLTDPAVDALRQARELGFQEPHLFLLLARVARHSGESDRAEDLARAGLERAPGDAALQHELGMALAARDRPADAVPWLSRAVENTPDELEFVEDLAMVQLRAGDADDAVSTLETALRRHPDAVDLLYVLARAQRRAGDGRAAETMRRFEEHQQEGRARRSAGERAMVEVREGVERWSQGRLDEAAERFRAALEERPGWIPARAYLAAALLELGQEREATELAREIRAEDPGNAQALLVLGRDALSEDPERGIELLEEAVELHPYRVVCLLSLAEAYLKLGRHEGVEELLDRAAAVEPDSPWLQDLRQQLASARSDGGDGPEGPS